MMKWDMFRRVEVLYRRLAFWVHDFFIGSPCHRQYKEIEYVSAHSPEECAGIHRHALQDILSFAVENVAFYCKYADDNKLNKDSLQLSDFPVVKKTDYLAQLDDFKVAHHHIPGQGNAPVYQQQTSGSSGIMLVVCHDRLRRHRRVAELKYFSMQEGYKSHERMLNIRSFSPTKESGGQTHSVYFNRADNIITAKISTLSDQEMEFLYEQMDKYKPVLVKGFTVSIQAMASYISRNRLSPLSVRLVICIGELLDDDVRKFIKETFNCECCSQYGCMEGGLLAYNPVPTTEGGNIFLLNHASFVFEVLKIDSNEPAEYGEPGRLVFTDLYNKAFPFIRYDTGDIVVMQEGNKASNGWPYLSEVSGRQLDIIFDTKHRVVLPTSILHNILHCGVIGRWQFEQIGEKQYTLLIDKAIPFDEEDVRESFKILLGADAQLNVISADEIPVMPSGKTKLIRSTICY